MRALNYVYAVCALLAAVLLMCWFGYETYLETAAQSIPCTHPNAIQVIKGVHKLFCANRTEHGYLGALQLAASIFMIATFTLAGLAKLLQKPQPKEKASQS